MRRSAPTGRRAVIVGNGSSVDRLPSAAWGMFQADEECIVVGTNRALCFEALRDIRLDAMVIRDRCRNLWYPQDWGIRYEQELWNPTESWKVGKDRTVNCDEFVRFVPTWQDVRVLDENREAAVLLQNSVVLMAANWAWLQGARELLLVGVDYCGRHARMIPPFRDAPMSWRGHYDRPVAESIEREFASAVASVESLGGTMVNISESTKLKAVPKATWKDALAS
jgi:hypothetical protein